MTGEIKKGEDFYESGKKHLKLEVNADIDETFKSLYLGGYQKKGSNFNDNFISTLLVFKRSNHFTIFFISLL